MVTWLGDWLRDIIAVIMLAVFMELLLPNKAMQRYARLVIGLLILLTILSPILRLLQGDFSARLSDSVRQWEAGSGTQDIKSANAAGHSEGCGKSLASGGTVKQQH
ncbi:stage III sporulation protein AF [Paenibacillus gorillae]|uniref:stage III sporulation protein AF n=1 Tax=Paenibacillus gorillae TaxID=1243662 RepID=UPI0004B331FA|nr:stage III sporulation protein AF [Paenibacillus gorillae]